jgi:hypothetical protein
MLSDIGDLEWKCVKSFVNAMGTIHWRPENCQLGMPIVHNWWRKDPMPFTKVVGQWKIYNFGIETLDHFCWKKLRKTRSMEGSLDCFCLDAQSAPSRRRRAHPCQGSSGPACQGRPASGGPCTSLPFFPVRDASKVLGRWHVEPSYSPVAAPPYATSPPRACTSPPPPLPMSWPCHNWTMRYRLSSSRPSIKGSPSSFLARCRAAAPPLPPPLAPTVSSTLRPSSPPTHAAPTFLLHHQSYHTRLSSRPDRRFAGAEPQRHPTPCSAGHLFAASEHSNRVPAIPRPLSYPSPAIPATGLAGIRPAAPPPLAQGLHCKVPEMFRGLGAN